jgi:hypothetical protein
VDRSFSFSQVSHTALDRVAPEEVALLFHIGSSCAACSTTTTSATTAGHAGQQPLAASAALSSDQRDLAGRVTELESEAQAHAAAAAEAASLAAAAAARASELERRLKLEVLAKQARLLEQQEVHAFVSRGSCCGELLCAFNTRHALAGGA